VWITFDDGWKGNYDGVFPVLKKEKIQATIFAVTGAIETTGVFWWTFAGKYKNLLPDKFRNDINLLWKVPDTERKKVIDELYEKVKDRLNREAITVEQLKEMSHSGYVVFGSHTVNHVITPNCTDEELNAELAVSKQKIEMWTGKTVNIFCYPNSDCSGRDEKLVKSNGYDIAVIAGNRYAGNDDKPLAIPRMGMGEAYFPEELCHMFGVWQRFIKKFKQN
jgi:poly-beta-1,6-N-acetyl-D-glucosamine N-deacetylase